MKSLGSLLGPSMGLSLSKLYNKNPLLVITEDTDTALRLETEIRFFAPALQNHILHFPDWETLPYDDFSPHNDIIAERLKTLYRLQQQSPHPPIIIVPIATLMQRVPPKTYVTAHTFILQKGDTLDLTEAKRQLESFGYRHVEEVITHGEFTVRGAILDVFPPGSNLPYRIDCFDNDIDSIRTFSPDNQRSIDTVDNIHCLPAKEFPMDEESIHAFKQRWREHFDGNPLASPMYQMISEHVIPPGVEYYLPLFFDGVCDFFSYLPENTQVVLLNDIHTEAQNVWKNIEARHEQCRHDIQKPLLAPETLWLTPEMIGKALQPFTPIRLTETPLKNHNADTKPLPDLSIEHKKKEALHAFKQFSNTFDGRILICAETLGRQTIITELFQKHQCIPHNVESWAAFLESTSPICITVAAIDGSVILADPVIMPRDDTNKIDLPEIAIICEADLFGQRVMQRRRRKEEATTNEAIIKNLAELTIGDPVVHLQHGIGRYIGLQTLTVGHQVNEFLTIEYDNHDKLYVPVSSLHLVSRYSGGENQHAPIHRLGTDTWEKTKRKAAEKAYDIAAELLHLYAERDIKKGCVANPPNEEYMLFANAFPFEETIDQQQAIDAVINDLSSEKNMDRLVCGDVGFGKTEVAMRAAFLMTQSHMQVAILVPTTLLAEQHGQNFKDRFAEWPINIGVLSRFKTANEQKALLDDIHDGKIDIVIGTHKLLQKGIQFKKLGLIVIDEEHRFGVKQKETLKQLRTQANVLTLTATPIPRTLNMAMSQLRDLSIIATPPAKRLSIKTFIYERKKHIIQEAINRELHRGGQVFFLHNNVKTIQYALEELQQLVPHANVHFAHGQMRERELERIMADFYHKRFNVLLCTTIIENGIDIPTANTIIIDRADKFGLAQLHQLRGRVGRSHHQAYAYLLRPEENLITSDAKKRLDAIASLGDLGAGFVLASHDLEIRGAGELLGEEQSGQMHEIGFSLYLELLEKATKDIQSGKTPEPAMTFDYGPEIDLQCSALIPDDYLPDIHSRLKLYKRIANANTMDDLDELQVEMIDRFGLLPTPTKALLNITALKLLAEPLGIKKIVANDSQCKVDFNDKTHVSPETIIKLIQTRPNTYQLLKGNRLAVKLKPHEATERYLLVKGVLEALQ